MSNPDALVVGSGPNGLAAAIVLAQAGLSVRVLEANSSIGGGVRSAELTLPGFTHDVCSAIHPMAAASPFFRQLPLEKFGLEWIEPPVALAHPLDGGRAACLLRSLDETAEGLHEDGAAWRRLFSPLVRHGEDLIPEILQPMLHFPRHPITMARFGMNALWPAAALARNRFAADPARALLAGMAAHSFLSLDAPASAAIGLVLGFAGHLVGWPLPKSGSQAITNALAAYFLVLGGEIETDHRVKDLRELPKARAVLLDLTAWQFADIAGENLPAGYRRHLTRFRHAPGVCKIDYALSAPIPWLADGCRQAGTVHLSGTLEEVAASEAAVLKGEHPEKPFVLVAQQSLFDDTRAPRGQHTLWAYCHVPHGSGLDMSERIEQQIERFAPGFRDIILQRHVMTGPVLQAHNPNLVGGDINGGAADLWQMIARPKLSFCPYGTPLPGVYLCSASTPPGGGVHGMAGWHAARAALRDVFR